MPAPASLYIDIETMPALWRENLETIKAGGVPTEVLAEAARDLVHKSPPKNYGPEAAQRWRMERARKHSTPESLLTRYQAWAVEPKLAEILCFAYAVNDGPIVVIRGPERQILRDLKRILWEEVQPRYILAWGGFGFDFPFIWERAMGHGMPGLARCFAGMTYGDRMRLGLQPPPSELVDPKLMWSTVRGSSEYGGRGWGNHGANVRSFLGIDVNNEITGRDVFAKTIEGDHVTVNHHVKADVEELRQVWQRMAPAIGWRHDV